MFLVSSFHHIFVNVTLLLTLSFVPIIWIIDCKSALPLDFTLHAIIIIHARAFVHFSLMSFSLHTFSFQQFSHLIQLLNICLSCINFKNQNCVWFICHLVDISFCYHGWCFKFCSLRHNYNLVSMLNFVVKKLFFNCNNFYMYWLNGTVLRYT